MARLGYWEVFVRKPLAVAVFSASIAIGIAVGCSAPSPDGTSLNRGRGSSSSGSDDDAETASSSSGGSNGGSADCSNHEKVDDRPACDQCARANCCAEVLECDKTADCAALLKCIDDCKGELICQLTCDEAHPKGSDALSGVAGCAQTKCETECPSQGVDIDGGFDFDAF